MKVLRTIWLSVFPVFMSSCGQDDAASSQVNVYSADASSEFSSVEPVTGRVALLRKIVEPGKPPVTRVTLNFVLNSGNKLAPISWTESKTSEQKRVLHVAAFKLKSLNQPTSTQPASFSVDLDLQGAVDEDDLVIQFNNGDSAKLPERLGRITPTSLVAVGNVSRLCPEGVTCIVDGTVIELETTTEGCFDYAAISYGLEVSAGGLVVHAGALNLANQDSEGVACFVANTVVSKIQLINQFYTAENVRLVVASHLLQL